MSVPSIDESVRVIVRSRPMNQREIELKCQNVVIMDTALSQVTLKSPQASDETPKQFTFDAVYPEDSITENIYMDSVFPLVESVLEGYNTTIFAYGQTGCGKSFTMQGVNTLGPTQRGIIPRSFEHIFEAVSVANDTKCLIRASYLEIYNDTIRDLLGKDVKATLDLKEYVNKGVQVQNLTWHICKNVTDCERLMEKGNKNRATGATLMNVDSSRSHSIFTIITEISAQNKSDKEEHIRAGKLNLVDLAGSERQSKTQAEGERLREATRINLSLSALGNVISALADNRSKSKYIPYRDSKLTRLLQDSLGGNAKTLMIAAISPADNNHDETLSTLRYANRTKSIKNKPRINEDPRDTQMNILKEEINRLKQDLINIRNISDGNQLLSSSIIIDDYEQIEQEKVELRAKFEEEKLKLYQQYESERCTNKELQCQLDILKNKYEKQINVLNDDEKFRQTDNRMSMKKKIRTNKLKQDDEDTVLNDLYKNDNKLPKHLDHMTTQEKLQILNELENKFIGGEEIYNDDKIKKRKNKIYEMYRKEAEKQRFNKEFKKNDDMMKKVFSNVQEELQYTSKKLQHTFEENRRLKIDNADLEREFEIERESYLSTIRLNEKQIELFRAIVYQTSNLLQRNCNYRNIDKILQQARYDEQKNEYIVPEPNIEEICLPHIPNLLMKTERHTPSHLNPMISINDSHSLNQANMNHKEPERHNQYKSANAFNLTTEKTLSKRQEKLLNNNLLTQSNYSNNDHRNRQLNPLETPSRILREYGSASQDKRYWFPGE